MSSYAGLPPQQLPMSKKGKEWRKKHLDWANSRSYFNYSPVRKSLAAMKINYDLVNGIIHMKDIEHVLNPNDIEGCFIPNKIQHYPIINSKLGVLRGEEAKRNFDFRVVVTNPNAVSEIENNKKKEIFEMLQQFVQNQDMSEDEANQQLTDMDKYYSYEWQDMREVMGNALLTHYIKELDVKTKFNEGFMDALTVGEEIYRCDIVGGEPIFERINPQKISIFRSGTSDKVEDADVIIIEDYLPIGKVYDEFGESLTKKDMEHLEKGLSSSEDADEMGNIDERDGFVNMHMIGDTIATDDTYFDPFNLFGANNPNNLTPFDMDGNVRVLRMYWKSRRRIKKVKSYDPETGEEVYNFYNEDYIINEAEGEEETIFYINEAWEGTLIGKNIYVNMRPRPIQYNRLSNPSRCHFGIVGTIYNRNESKPYSLVDMMKPYSYMYDVIYDRLLKTVANNWGKIIQMDFAKIPDGWTPEQWMYWAKENSIAVIDSFKEGNKGAATGKISGALNTNTTGVIDADLSQAIMGYINLLVQTKDEMGEISGISKQREGQVSNRETVGGVERATLQSSHITEWWFMKHDNNKKRCLEMLLETAKIAIRGKSKKFSYILPNYAVKMMDIDGNLLAENDYGLVVDSDGVDLDKDKLEAIVQAGMQTQSMLMSTAMKALGSSSLAEKQRMIEQDEQMRMQQQQQQQQAQLQQQQQQAELQMQMQQMQMQLQNEMNMRDNETKLQIAQLQAAMKMEPEIPVETQMTEKERFDANLKERTLEENRRQFDEKQKLERDKFGFDQRKAEMDKQLKERQISVQRMKKTSNSN